MAEQVKDCKGNCSCNSYLHTAFSRPIIHRNKQLENIFLDQNNVAKLTEFSPSISIPKGGTHAVVDYLGGTAEFICPNYFSTFYVMEIVDAYSFGSFLLELLTGRRLGHLAQAAKDEGGGGAGVEQQVQAVLQLALICREQDPEIRPNMIDVTKELRNIERFIP
ncbi:non-functional pseudokinase ZRK2-like [Quercus robur]|uniref:non-functional pseudokinase ZRK2-like n=1 Tax=Quercus robur TaxID=38942 RepID=UPI0021615095|nr:non-functional pseudokinase ZRK2-like [Quercus robur]